MPTVSTFVLIPGACHGGWWFEPLARRLRDHGHQAYAVTLTGLGDRSHLIGGSINLDTHIDDVLSLLVHERLEDVILVGHSYAGMVVSAVADRVPERIDALVYVDAFVPENGDSAWSLTNDEQRRWYIDGAGADGLGVEPLPFFDARATPHPLASLVQRVRLSGAEHRFRRRDYVYATRFPGSPFTPTYERLLADPGWRVHAVESGHNVLADGTALMTEILLGTISSG
ncbi:alpha/beta fold hydrolase [Nocardia sp. NPDC004068]|uniref:alpha/beta hydrolase n=1 Tax=Nocardia sp. NPDC004068 TaxID=3364303 RepID=UPI0036B93F72